jgi:NAD(P)-dependent dehydrogenase (short-subunit alcohol dehydrogenase family)
MIAQGGGGKIINFASQALRRGEALVAVHCASKAAVISLTQNAGLDLIKRGINVNAIAPGVVDNEHWDNVDSLFAWQEGLAAGEKKRLVGASYRAHGSAGRNRRVGDVPRECVCRLYCCSDVQHRRCQLDELIRRLRTYTQQSRDRASWTGRIDDFDYIR